MKNLLVQNTLDKINTIKFNSNETLSLKNVLQLQANVNIDKENELATQVKSDNYLEKLEELMSYGREQKARYETIEKHMQSVSDLVWLITEIIDENVGVSTEEIKGFSNRILDIIMVP